MLNGCGCYPVDYDPTVQKELAERALFLALVGREYPKSFLADFPLRLLYLLLHSAESFPSAPRLKLAEAFVVLVQSKVLLLSLSLSKFIGLIGLYTPAMLASFAIPPRKKKLVDSPLQC
jgi:hypothetical protein